MTLTEFNLIDLVEALRAREILAAVTDDDGVNVWQSAQDRFAYTTVWAPRRGNGWVWGAAFECSAPVGVDLTTLADAVAQTIKAAIAKESAR